MDVANDLLGGIPGLYVWAGCLALPLLLLMWGRLGASSPGAEPASLPHEGLPFIGNTYQYITDNARFLARARYAAADDQRRAGSANDQPASLCRNATLSASI